MTITPNAHQGTPSANDLDAVLAAEEAARWTPEPEAEEPVVEAEADELAAEADADDQPETEAEEGKAEPEKHEETESEIEKRISRLAYERRAAERRARELEAELARVRGTAPKLPEDEALEKAAEAKAHELARVKEFNDKANSIYAEGKKAFGDDFDTKLKSLHEAGLPLSPMLVEAAAELGDAHRIIHYLAKNPDEMEMISNMQAAPHRMAAALAKVAAKATAPVRQATKAPAPIKPVGGRVARETSPDKLTMEEFIAAEEKKAATKKRRWE